MIENELGRIIPEKIDQFGKLLPFKGAYANTPLVKKEKGNRTLPKLNKLVDSIKDAIIKSNLKDGMTISFHHHFRNGDKVLSMVMDVIAKMGFKKLTIAGSSLTEAHNDLIRHIKNGVVIKLVSSGIRGALAEEISNGLMDIPVLIHSHGGRARAIETGQVKIDVAFLGVPSSDVYGNANGYSGKSACGSLGYAMVDSAYAEKIVLITDNIVEYPNIPFSIHQDQVDFIVVVDSIGDPEGITTGATRITNNPKDLLLAQLASEVVVNSGYFENGFSIQTGLGGASVATTRFLRKHMEDRGIKASWALGGISGPMVKLHEDGFISRLIDVQSFDSEAIRSIGENRYHLEIDASYYANPLNKGCAVNKLNIVILSALEIDTDFNVNVITGSDGVIRGASGGHSDTAIGSGLSIIVAPLIRGRTATVTDSVKTIITPGSTVDVLVTDRGIAVNPRREEIKEKLRQAGLPVYSIEELKLKAEKIVGRPEPIRFKDKIVGLVEYRDGTIIDVIKQVLN
ncbi:MAG: citrate lyase subunit alpha [Spirochaetaceae bacterium]|nr:citrate lyase subunit alpha [Spirochaetaceae bacterium]